MKTVLPFGTLVVGLGIGWMLKESPEMKGDAAEAAKPAKVETRPSAGGNATADSSGAAAAGKSHDRPLKIEEPKGDEFAKLAMDEASKQMMDAMKERHAKRAEERIAKLVEKLGLDAAQEAKLRDFFKQQEAGREITVGENGRNIRMNLQANGGSLDDFLKDILTDPQKESYEQLKGAEQDQKIEARTLREMASLTQAVELRPDQRDAVYAILQEQAKNDVSSGGAMGMVSVGGMPPIELGVGEAVDSVVSIKVADGAQGDQKAVMDQIQQQQQAKVDEKVNRMSGVLDEKQLAQYRSSLEQGGMPGMMVLPR